MFGSCFNKSISGNIPGSVKNLVFGIHYDQPLRIGDIPNSVTHLSFYGFNSLSTSVIPGSVSHLTLGECYNFYMYDIGDTPDYIFGNPPEYLTDHIPSSVTHLTLGDACCRTKIKIPESITWLKLGATFNTLEYITIPESLVCLNVYRCTWASIKTGIPWFIKEIALI